MTTSKDLLLAILAMDSYNRGYGPGITGLGDAGTKVGNATIRDIDLPAGSQAAGFYAISYTLDASVGEGADVLSAGSTVISYRGTDGDDVPDWLLGAGDWQVDQARLAAQFYQAVNDDAITPNANAIGLQKTNTGGRYDPSDKMLSAIAYFV